jgi:hypothetical protein
MHHFYASTVYQFDDVQYKETNEVDPYVRLSLFDPTSGGTEAFRSTTQMNDASPRCTLHVHKAMPSTTHCFAVVQEPGLGTLHGAAALEKMGAALRSPSELRCAGGTRSSTSSMSRRSRS